MNRTDGVKGEWPVSYHGTKQVNADSIIHNGYDLGRGKRFVHGKGIYSTPSPAVAESYAKPFEHEGKKYKLMFMNRVNLDYTLEKKVSRNEVYNITSDDKQIRPYAILIKKMD